jgi:antibiotic biosynthesis monooxygenase (ABM) superfamily enzyme
VVWLAIYPSITLIQWLVGPKMKGWPLALRTLAITAGVVPLMVHLLVPAFSDSWLHGYVGHTMTCPVSSTPVAAPG